MLLDLNKWMDGY